MLWNRVVVSESEKSLLNVTSLKLNAEGCLAFRFLLSLFSPDFLPSAPLIIFPTSSSAPSRLLREILGRGRNSAIHATFLLLSLLDLSTDPHQLSSSFSFLSSRQLFSAVLPFLLHSSLAGLPFSSNFQDGPGLQFKSRQERKALICKWCVLSGDTHDNFTPGLPFHPKLILDESETHAPRQFLKLQAFRYLLIVSRIPA